jgi:hypothetical protein
MTEHFGMPGPGGSMGKCAVCGDSFIVGVIKDLCGMGSDVGSFSVGFVDQTLYCHMPKCKEHIEAAFALAALCDDKDEKNATVRDNLPDGPLKQCLIEAIDSLQEGNSDD